MQPVMFKKLSVLLFVLLVPGLVYMTSNAAPASRNLLDSVVVKRLEAKTVVQINFKQALSYQWHHPKDQGIELSIGMKQLTNRDNTAGFRESIGYIRDYPALVEVTLLKEVDKEPVLVLEFAQELAYEVVHEGDFRQLSIIVFDDLPADVQKENTVKDKA